MTEKKKFKSFEVHANKPYSNTTTLLSGVGEPKNLYDVKDVTKPIELHTESQQDWMVKKDIGGEHDNFIGIYDNVLPEPIANDLIKLVSDKTNIYVNPRKEAHRQDSQILIEQFYNDISAAITKCLMENAAKYYIHQYSALEWPGHHWVSGATILQMTKPSEGYHQWHCEDLGFHRSRDLAWMIYLNDLQDDDDGGETEFLYQRVRLKPKKNQCVIWPGSFTHTHRGNPPLKKNKYILTGWLCMMSSNPPKVQASTVNGHKTRVIKYSVGSQ